MRKHLTVLLVCIILFSICACKQRNNEQAESSSATTTTAKTSSTTAETTASTTTQKLTTTTSKLSTTTNVTTKATKTTTSRLNASTDITTTTTKTTATTKAMTTVAKTTTRTTVTPATTQKLTTTTNKLSTTTNVTTKATKTTTTVNTTNTTTTKPSISKEEYSERLEFWFIGISYDFQDSLADGLCYPKFFLAENIDPEYKIESVTIDSVFYNGEKCAFYETKNKNKTIPVFNELCDWWDDFPPLEDALEIYDPEKVIILEIKPVVYYKEGWGWAIQEDKDEYTINYTISFEDGDVVSLSHVSDRLSLGAGGLYTLKPEDLE